MQTFLFITDLMSGSRLPETAGIREYAAQRGWHLELIELQRLAEPLRNVIAYWKPMGAIVEGSGKSVPEAASLSGIPLVHLDPNDKTLEDPGAFTVMNDAEAIADLAIHELVRTECSAFAFVGWSHDVGWSYRREQRFANRLKQLGKRCAVLSDPWTLGNKADFAMRLRPFLQNLARPCGIFAANDDIATAILDFCALDGIAIPGDFYLLGVDDKPEVCDNTTPTLSSIRPNFKLGGRLAAQLLGKRIDTPETKPEHLLYRPLGLTSRLSTRRFTQTDGKVLKALDLIRREACNGLKAEDVVRFMGVSDRLAEMRFKAATGRRITEEITAIRLKRVLELLANPNQLITPIANLCGWDSEVYLKRLFRKRYGLTMREWRKKRMGARD